MGSNTTYLTEGILYTWPPLLANPRNILRSIIASCLRCTTLCPICESTALLQASMLDAAPGESRTAAGAPQSRSAIASRDHGVGAKIYGRAASCMYGVHVRGYAASGCVCEYGIPQQILQHFNISPTMLLRLSDVRHRHVGRSWTAVGSSSGIRP